MGFAWFDNCVRRLAFDLVPLVVAEYIGAGLVPSGVSR